MPDFIVGKTWTKDESDAIAWRQVMRTTENLDEALFNAWLDWREREAENGRVARAVGDKEV